MKLLADIRRDGRRVRVYERAQDASRSYFDGMALYTQIDAHGNNLLSYVDAMAQALRDRARVLILGAAGGALATKLHRGGARVAAVDNWPAAFEIARRWFFMPADIECFDSDALAFLNATERRWPAIALDVFDRGRIPERLLKPDFAAALAAAVEPGGLAVWNVADSASSAKVRTVEAILRGEGFEVSRTPVLSDDIGNTLVIGRRLLDPQSGNEPLVTHAECARPGVVAALPAGGDLRRLWIERPPNLLEVFYGLAHGAFANLYPLDRART